MARQPHPTTNETIDKILSSMEPGRWYPFGELWGPVYGYAKLADETYNTYQLRRCLKQMLHHNLVEVVTKRSSFLLETADWNTGIATTDLGDKIRESGGWLKHIETVNAPRKKIGGHAMAVIVELLIAAGLLYYAYRQDVRADRLELQEIKYKEREQEIKSLQTRNTDLEKKVDSISELLKLSPPPKKK